MKKHKNKTLEGYLSATATKKKRIVIRPMTRSDISETLTIPEGVSVSIKDHQLVCKGPAGETSRNILVPGITVTTDEKTITLTAKGASKREKKLLFTFKAHIRNLVKGALEAFRYELKICSGHFPMSVSIKGDQFEIKNFIGEKVPRKITIKTGASVKISGEIIEVTANNKELAGQVAADIEKLTRRTNFDKRIFQDGIYITNKAGKQM